MKWREMSQKIEFDQLKCPDTGYTLDSKWIYSIVYEQMYWDNDPFH